MSCSDDAKSWTTAYEGRSHFEYQSDPRNWFAHGDMYNSESSTLCTGRYWYLQIFDSLDRPRYGEDDEELNDAIKIHPIQFYKEEQRHIVNECSPGDADTCDEGHACGFATSDSPQNNEALDKIGWFCTRIEYCHETINGIKVDCTCGNEKFKSS